MSPSFVLRQFRAFVLYGTQLGWIAGIRWRLHEIRTNLGYLIRRSIRIQPKGIKTVLTLRGGTSSDKDVFRQIFIEREYGVLDQMTPPAFIVDAGANIGLSSVYFLNRFPDAHILAIEPDPDNYVVCCENLKSYGDRVRILQGALWYQSAKLALVQHSYRDKREWATQVREANTDSERVVTAWSVSGLMELTGVRKIDLLKIDIEGSERELFIHDTGSWLPAVRAISIELHDHQCEQAFFAALSNYRYQLLRSGELTVCMDLRTR